MGQRTRIARAMVASAITTLVAAGLSGCGGGTGAQQQETTAAAPADPRAEAAQNVRLVGYHDLQGRTALVVTTKSDAGERQLGLRRAPRELRDGKPLLNPITGKMEWNGTSILEIADPAKPKLVWHIPNETNRNSRGVSVVYDYKFDGVGPRLSDSQLRGADRGRNRHRISSTRSSTSPRGTATRRRSRWSSEITGTPPELVRPGLRRQVHHARAQGLVVAGDRLLLRRVRRAGLPQRHRPDLRPEESEGAEVRRPRLAARA